MMSQDLLNLKQWIGKDSDSITAELQNVFVSGSRFIIYKVDKLYYFIKFVDGCACGLAVFSNEKKLVDQYGLIPVDFELLDTDNFDSYHTQLGKWHFDYGSGFCLPAYLTNNFEIVIFENDGDKVVRISKIDIASKTKSVLWAMKRDQPILNSI